MKVKLLQSMAGERFSFVPRQIIECSDRAGGRLVEKGIATEAADDAEVEGVLHDKPPKRTPRPKKETATKPKPETPETGEPAADKCGGTTKAGNPCKKGVIPDTGHCQTHQP